jgi:hypothetical protein
LPKKAHTRSHIFHDQDVHGHDHDGLKVPVPWVDGGRLGGGRYIYLVGEEVNDDPNVDEPRGSGN